jgi:hypothetical protein
MSRRITSQAVIANIIGAAVVMVIIFGVPGFIISWMRPGAVQPVHWETLVTGASAVAGAAIATRHWLAPVLLAAAFLLLPVLGWLPTKSARFSDLLMVGATALAIIFIEVALLLASLILIVRGFIRNFPRRS